MTAIELIRDAGTRYDADATPSGGYEKRPDTFHLQFDPETEPVAHAVVKAVSFVHNVEQTDLPPLAGAIDPEALDSLVSSGDSGPTDCLEVRFTYEELQITVVAEGTITLTWA